jgi:hypothetical protein
MLGFSPNVPSISFFRSIGFNPIFPVFEPLLISTTLWWAIVVSSDNRLCFCLALLHHETLFAFGLLYFAFCLCLLSLPFVFAFAHVFVFAFVLVFAFAFVLALVSIVSFCFTFSLSLSCSLNVSLSLCPCLRPCRSRAVYLTQS